MPSRLSFVVLAVVALAASFSSRARAQGWKLYAEQLRGGAAEETTEAPTVSSGGALDLSSVLVDDGAEATGSVVEDPPEPTAAVFASLPSYRSLASLRSDARLNDLCFVSATTGWVVGDRGTILKTTDGGATWTACESPTDANLYGVSFLDANFGLAVGGRSQTSTVGQGVALRTTDGGATWSEIPLAAYPILRAARILDAETAWIAGDSSNLYPSGLFVGTESCEIWTPVALSRAEGWRSALYDPAVGLGLGATTSGKIQRAEGDRAELIATELGRLRARDVCYDGATGAAWLVGDRGTTLLSTDFGASWRPAVGAPPSGAAEYFDLMGVVAKDGFVGAVGSPGSLFFYSEDGGATWSASATGVSTPLRKACFFDRATGWAVGDFGTIVATRDGGRTWRLQRGGNRRAAILAILGRASDAPFEAFAQLCGEEGYRAEVALVARETEREGTATEAPFFDRFEEALVETGANGAVDACLFALNPKIQGDSTTQILARFDAENDGDGLARLRERLVRAIRTWRPDVALVADSALDATETTGAETQLDARDAERPATLLAAIADDANRIDDAPRDPLRELILRELPGALRDAADPTAYPEHISLCRLEPWRAVKARAICRGAAQGDATISSDAYCSTLGRAVGEIGATARRITGLESETPTTTRFQTLFNLGTPTNGERSFFDGLAIGRDTASRRAVERSSFSDELATRAGARRQLLGLFERLATSSETNASSGEALLAQLNSGIAGRDAAFAAECAAKVGRAFAKLGDFRAAEEAYSTTPVELYDRAESREAVAWLVQYFSGSEPSRAVELSREVVNDAGAQAQSAPRIAFLQEDRGARLARVAELAETLRDVAPDAFMSSEIRFPYACAQLALGDYQGAMRFYLNRSLASSDDLWGVRAAAEYWLRAPQGDVRGPGSLACPLRATRCRGAASKPYLDGELEQNVWDAAEKTPLTSPDAQDRPLGAAQRANLELSTNLGSSIAFLYDDEYLYVGATFPKPGAARAEANVESERATTEPLPPRRRDANLQDRDRLEIMIDVDGDYATACRIEIDDRGWVCDSLWGAKSWNPKLFVATRNDRAQWSLEAAIPLKALVPESPRRGATWRVAFRRVAPGSGVECWNAENSDRGENAFGILSFE